MLGSYGIGYLAMPSSKELETSISAQMSSDQIKAELDSLAHDIKGRVPAEVSTLADSISQSIITILPTLAKDGSMGDQNTYTILRPRSSICPRRFQIS